MNIKEESGSKSKRIARNTTTVSQCVRPIEMETQENAKAMECVVISDDESSDSLTENYPTEKYSTSCESNATESVVILADEDQPGPSCSGTQQSDHVNLTPRPTSIPIHHVDLDLDTTEDLTPVPGDDTTQPDPISIDEEDDDDEPVITNIIDPARDERTNEPVTWQLVRSDETSVRPLRRSGIHARYRSRHAPATRRAVRPRESDLMRFVRDLTSDGVVIRSHRAIRSHNGGYYYNNDINNTRAGSMSDPMSRPVDPMSRGAMAGGDHVAGGGDGVSLSSLWGRGQEELVRVSSLRNRITTLRRDLQNLNGLLATSFQLLNRISPAQSLPRIDKSVLDRAPTKLASSADIAREKACSICLGKYVEGDILRVLPCDHEFHEVCIDRWLLNCSCKCPFCRADIQEALQTL